jgi:hypothetical protein
VSEQPKFAAVPNKPFPIEVHPVGREHLAVRGPGVDITLCVHGALTLASMLTDVANKQYCDGYIHGDESTMLVSPKTPSRPTTITDALNELMPTPKHPPTCETLDELLQKIQTFVQEHSGVEVIPLDDISSRLWGYAAYFVENGLETSICETVRVQGVSMSDALRDSLMPVITTAGGRITLAEDLRKGRKFV